MPVVEHDPKCLMEENSECNLAPLPSTSTVRPRGGPPSIGIDQPHVRYDWHAWAPRVTRWSVTCALFPPDNPSVPKVLCQACVLKDLRSVRGRTGWWAEGAICCKC